MQILSWSDDKPLVAILPVGTGCMCILDRTILSTFSSVDTVVPARDVLSQQFLGSGHFRVAKKIYPRVGSGQRTTWVSQNSLLRIRAMATNY